MLEELGVEGPHVRLADVFDDAESLVAAVMADEDLFELISEEVRIACAVRADAQTEAALLEILESFCPGFAARDADGVMQLFAADADVVMVTSENRCSEAPMR